MSEWIIRVLEHPDELYAVEEMQRLVWPGSETEVVPVHLLLTAAHNGGLVIAAYDPSRLVEGKPMMIGFVFGFPGFYMTPDGPRLKHCSHMLGVHPDYRDKGVGFLLKRAQWQMVRQQQIDRVTWTYDPLQSRNAYFNIVKLGAVCSTYKREVYGTLRDGINVGLPTDRFEVDWWVNTQRVKHRLSREVRRRLDLAHYFDAGAEILNPTRRGEDGLPYPPAELSEEVLRTLRPVGGERMPNQEGQSSKALILVEIPSDFMALKSANPSLAIEWRMHTRAIFEDLFARGYLVTDFVYLPGTYPRSFYILSDGESTL